MSADAVATLLWLAGGLLLTAAFGALIRIGREANRAAGCDWGHPVTNVIDGLNRVFLRTWHRCDIQTVPLPPDGPALVVANHVSGLDPLLILAACHRPVHFIIAREEYERFGLTWLFRLGECIPVDRSSRDDSAFRAALDALAAGKVVALFPSGRIHLPEEGPARLRRGVARLSRLSGAPVFPCRIDGVRLPGHVLPAVFLPGRARLRAFSSIACARLGERACLAALAPLINGERDVPMPEEGTVRDVRGPIGEGGVDDAG